jgi:hypothetical protein
MEQIINIVIKGYEKADNTSLSAEELGKMIDMKLDGMTVLNEFETKTESVGHMTIEDSIPNKEYFNYMYRKPIPKIYEFEIRSDNEFTVDRQEDLVHLIEDYGFAGAFDEMFSSPRTTDPLLHNWCL